MNKKKKICILIIILFVLWMSIGITDYVRVYHFEKPLFCVGVDIADDGGSGHYVGLGYSVDIFGNFVSEEEPSGVISFSYYVFGIRVLSGVKD